jgi:PAS domain S-box-containing protein
VRRGYPHIVTLRRSPWADLARRSRELNHAMVSAVLGTVIVLDGSGKIVALDRARTSPPEKYSSTIIAGARLGQNFLSRYERVAAHGSEQGRQVFSGVRSVLDRTKPHFTMDYQPDSAKTRWFRILVKPLASNLAGAIVWETEITGHDSRPEEFTAGSLAISSLLPLPKLLEAIVGTLSVAGALVTELPEDQHDRGRIIAVSSRLDALSGESFDLAGTATEQVLRLGDSFVPSNVQNHFPDDLRLKAIRTESYLGIRLLDSSSRPIGSLEVLHDRPMKNGALREAILNYVRDWAAGELERLRAERQQSGLLSSLRQAERRYHALFDGLGDGILVVDSNLRYVDCNNAALSLLGVFRDHILGRRVGELSGTSMEDIMADQRRLHQEGHLSREWRIARTDGKVLWVDIKSTQVELPQGPGYAVILHDITARKESEAALQTLEEMHSRVIGAIPDMMFRMRADGTYLEYTPAQENEPLVPESEFLGRTASEVLPPEVASACMQGITEALRSGATQQVTYQLEIGGELRDYESRIIPMDKEQVLAIVRDYTAQKRREQEVARREEREELEGKAERLILGRNPYMLTFREFTVLQLLADGVADKEIAERLGVSIFTINKHVANILAKMHAASRTEAAVRAQREGLLS